MQIDAELCSIWRVYCGQDLLIALCFVWYFLPSKCCWMCKALSLYMRCTVWPGEVCVFEWNRSKEFGNERGRETPLIENERQWRIEAFMSMFVRSHEET